MRDSELMKLNYKVISEHKKNIPWKKVYLLIALLSLILISIVTLIIIYMLKKDSNSNENKEIPDNNNDDIKDIYFAKILCKYKKNSSNEIEILSQEFIKTTNFEIYMNNDNISIPYSKTN